jgi:hypothetical protein
VVEVYRELVETVLSHDRPPKATLARLSNFKTTNYIKDEDHERALEVAGWTKEEFARGWRNRPAKKKAGAPGQEEEGGDWLGHIRGTVRIDEETDD